MKGLKGMKKPCLRALTIMLMVIVAMTLVAQPALAAKQPDNPLPGSKIEQEYTRAINTLERYLSISETGNIVLNAPKRVVNSIDSEVYQSLLAGLEQTNSMIDSGYLVANPDFTLTVTEKYLEASGQYLEPNSQLVAEGNAVILSSSSGGITATYSYWWGYWIYLSDATCDAISYALKMGVGIAAIVGASFPPGAPIAIILGALSGMAAATIDYVNRNNTGIKIRINYTWIGPPIITYIGAQ